MMAQNPAMPMQQMGGNCPACGCPMPSQTMGYFKPMGAMGWGGMPVGMGVGGYGGVGGFQPPWMGTYPAPMPSYWSPGIASDDQIRQLVYDSLDADPAIPYDSDIHVEVTGGIVTLTGTVPNKRIKHAAGDDAWWIPQVIDVNNRLEVVGRRQRATGEGEAPAEAPRRGRAAGGRATTTR